MFSLTVLQLKNVFLQLKSSLDTNKQQLKTNNLHEANEHTITCHQSSTIETNKSGYLLVQQTSYERSTINRCNNVECSVNEQSALSLGFCYRRPKYGQLVPKISHSFIPLFFFSLIVVLQFADDRVHFKLRNGSVSLGHFLVNCELT